MTDGPITLGHAGEQPLDLDLDRLIGSHLGIVANAGGGKSGLIRKLLETTHGRIQHIVLDIEDEFYTLRQHYDYVIAGGETGDAPLTVENAGSLARAALAHGFSLICQLNDLGGQGAREFVDAFLASMISAPRDLWRPCLVVIDEAQRHDAASILMLTERGRKRGFTAVLASQRLPKIDPNIRGDLNNWIMGRVGQSLDRRIMADQLGMSTAQARELAKVGPRHFWAMGPALSIDPVLFKVDEVETTMVRPGQAKVPTPPAPEALREILSGLAVEPKQDSQIATDIVADDNRLSDMLAKAEATIRDLARANAECAQVIADVMDERDELRRLIGRFSASCAAVPEAPAQNGDGGSPVEENPGPADAEGDGHAPQADEAGSGQRRRAVVSPERIDRTRDTPPSPEGRRSGDSRRPSSDIPASQQRVLDAIAWWAAIGIAPVERNRAAVIAGLSPKASTFGVYVSKLAQAGLVDTSMPGSVALTDAGRTQAGDPGRVNKRDVTARARAMLKPAAANVFDKILGHWPRWVRRDELADEVGLSRTASTLGVYISESSKLGFVDTRPGEVRIAEWMMP